MEFTITLTDLEIAAVMNALEEWDSTASIIALRKIQNQTGLK